MTGKQLAKKILDGDKLSLAKGITLICSHLEKDKEKTHLLLKELLKAKRESYKIGISGIGGVGKSTFIAALGNYILQEKKEAKIAVLTIDPSSPKRGGSILGDGVRMGGFSSNERVFVRSIANKGALGGVNYQAQEVVFLLEAAGYEFVLIESVGSGQSDTKTAYLCDVFINLQMPASGDGIQAIKKGGGELADIVVIHKNDGALKLEAEKAFGFYRQAHSLLRATRDQVFPKVILVSSHEKKGFAELWSFILQKKELDLVEGTLKKKREERSLRFFKELLGHAFLEEIFAHDIFSGRMKESYLRLVERRSTPLLEARDFVHSLLHKS